ncbi:hypothetical protein LAZ67_8003712 [Cordylochernes scorpioides]|uniref:Major facilitator superfamily (MFS) profile domain-containing protein n=1 Tax=Cordylochernes scorpioides TaxID=51811 RepID=A0ABY6KS98_9ARAC|nr:hypothetical protein LAZ67_8003712 [Cordylochernes scorpioides]
MVYYSSSTVCYVQSREYNWTSGTQGVLLGSFFYGYIVTQIPGGYSLGTSLVCSVDGPCILCVDSRTLKKFRDTCFAGYFAGMFGGRTLFAGGIFCTAVLTLLTPLAAHVGPGLLVVVRILEGLCEGVTFPAMHTIWGKWAPPMEKTKLATTAWSGTYIGTVVALPLSGLLSDTVSWQSVFYCFGEYGPSWPSPGTRGVHAGSVAVVWSGLWLHLIRDSPEDHETISPAELEYLRSTVGPIRHKVQWRIKQHMLSVPSFYFF